MMGLAEQRIMAKPTLTVVHGGVRRVPPWLDFPASVVALSPTDKTRTCRFRLSRQDATRAAQDHRLQRIWEFWSAVIGEPPPVPNVKTWGANHPAEEGLTQLVEAHACFQGIKRPMAEDSTGEQVVIYVLKPRFFYEHAINLVCAAAKRATPSDLVYVAHARLDVPYDPENSTIGVVTHGGFVQVDPHDPLLPENHRERYDKRLW
jgi:hypothetical protein